MSFFADVPAALLIQPIALMESSAVLRKIKAQMAVVALRQFRRTLWPKLLHREVAFGILNPEAFDEGFGIGAELSASGDHRAQVQPVGK